MNCLIRTETSLDYERVREVIKSAFYREGKDSEFNEWSLVDRIRDSKYYINDISLVAEFEGNIVGHILFTQMKVNNENNSYNSLALAPVSVHKDYQKKGIGKLLVRSGIEKAKELGYRSIIVMGHPEYYTKFGFTLASKYHIGTTSDFNDKCLFGLDLVDGELSRISGVIQYCPPFYNEEGELI